MINGPGFAQKPFYACLQCRKALRLEGRRSRQLQRTYATAAARPIDPEEEGDVFDDALHKFDEHRRRGRRFNEVGIQQIDRAIHRKIFPLPGKAAPRDLIHLSRLHLQQHELLGKNEKVLDDVPLELPSLQGQSLDEHFHRLGVETAEPYLRLSKQFAESELPDMPNHWEYQSGWTRYNENGSVSAVDYPDEEALVFDTEVLYKISPYPVMACAASKNAWYSWVSPWLMGTTRDKKQLIPLGNNRNKVIIGHNIGYDRPRIREEYDLKETKNRFVDTLSLHQAANGMCSRQRPEWVKHNTRKAFREKVMSGPRSDLHEVLEYLEDEPPEDLWIEMSSTNSLREVANFHCGAQMDKEVRKFFDSTEPKDILDNFSTTMSYCAEDVRLTHLVYRRVLPNYLEIAPHPVSFAGILLMNSMILPVNQNWPKYLESAEGKYQELLREVHSKLVSLCEETVKLKDDPSSYENDPWLSQLDWTTKPIRYTKDKKTGKERLAGRQKLPGMPQWYRDLYKSTVSQGMNLTVRSRVSPILLKLNWEGSPLVWSDKYGWIIKAITPDGAKVLEEKNYVKLDMSKEPIEALAQDVDGSYYKVPHKDGPSSRVASPLAKAYIAHFEKGILSSEYPVAEEALKMNAMCSYWISSRDRISSQMVVWQRDLKNMRELKAANLENVGVILPQTVAMGTITRRATEATWMTASNAKKTRVGSELKSMVQAPPGYCFVGADVDSEELWIASLMGDAQFQAHGATALGWMTLEGEKPAGTDLHSKTADILGISRNDAKVFNYGRIYGAGLKFAIQLLQQFNPALSEAEAKSTAEKLYVATKGIKARCKAASDKVFWAGGTESYVFNRLETMAELDEPRTPVLGCGITQALQAKYLSPGGFLTSRVNWAIQSSGVDYLHLLITSMSYLTKLLDLDARIALTVHDEIRYLVAEKDQYVAAYALQVANLWTRAMFSEQLGIKDLPMSCAWFSEVDIDHVLRKDVAQDCVTPSHETPIPPGNKYTIYQLMDRLKDEPRVKQFKEINLNRIPYQPRTRVFDDLQHDDVRFLEAQNMKSTKDIDRLYTKQDRRSSWKRA